MIQPKVGRINYRNYSQPIISVSVSTLKKNEIFWWTFVSVRNEIYAFE